MNYSIKFFEAYWAIWWQGLMGFECFAAKDRNTKRLYFMKAQGMTSEVFLTAFKIMPRKEQNIFLYEDLKTRRKQ
jgi:hypothetical protein